jgi:hypothetical protein
MEELAALPAAAAVVILNERSIPSPRGGLWYEAQVIQMRKLLAAGPRRRTRKRLLECDRMQGHCCPVDGGYDFSIALQDKGF